MIPIVSAITGILNRIIPDKNALEKAKIELQLLESKGELDLMLAQTKVNQKEAEHASIFVAGWRPWIGWVCGIALTWHWVVEPIFMFILLTAGVDMPDMPRLAMSELMSLTLALLGVGGLRTYERLKQVERNTLK